MTEGDPKDTADAQGEGKDDVDEKNELKSAAKQARSNSNSSAADKKKTDKENDNSSGGGKKKKKKKKDKKKKTAHFKKRGNPVFKYLFLVFLILAVLCLIGCLVFVILLANNVQK